MLQTMEFEINRYSLQHSGDDVRILCTAEELERFTGCYFWMGLAKMRNQYFFWKEDLSYTGFLSFLSKNWFETLIWSIHVAENLSVDVKTKEDNKLCKIRPWIENLRQNFLKVSPEKFSSVDEIMVPYRGGELPASVFPNELHRWRFKNLGTWWCFQIHSRLWCVPKPF